MGTIIKSVSFMKSLPGKDILAMTARISERCLHEAGLSIEEIGMLINTSVYSGDHRSEPALASLIQSRLETKRTAANPNPDTELNLFSFDLHNGGGGVINAMQVLDGFITSRQITNGLIVAGDSAPLSGLTNNYPYENSAAAVILSEDPQEIGFAGFLSETFPEFENDFQSVINWGTGQLTLEIAQKENYLSNCILCAEKSILKFLHNENLTPEDIDLLITSQSPVRFPHELQKRMPWKNGVVVNGTNREVYTSGLLFSLHSLFSGQRYTAAKNILFVNVGPGITVSVSLYINN